MGDVKKRVNGISGIFFKARDPERLWEWHERHLGITRDNEGATFRWRDPDDPITRGDDGAGNIQKRHGILQFQPRSVHAELPCGRPRRHPRRIALQRG